MPPAEKSVRQSVTVPAHVARRVRSMARIGRTSANRVLVDLIESGLEAKEEEKRRFFDVAERFRAATDPDERARLKKELARLTFGE